MPATLYEVCASDGTFCYQLLATVCTPTPDQNPTQYVFWIDEYAVAVVPIANMQPPVESAAPSTPDITGVWLVFQSGEQIARIAADATEPDTLTNPDQIEFGNTPSDVPWQWVATFAQPGDVTIIREACLVSSRNRPRKRNSWQPVKPSIAVT